MDLRANSSGLGINISHSLSIKKHPSMWEIHREWTLSQIEQSVFVITFNNKAKYSKYISRASLVVQCLRICLLMQGTRVRALVWEDPTCRGASGPVSHNY